MATKKSYRRYSPEFKREAIRRACEEGMTDAAVCKEPGISTRQFRRWRDELHLLGEDAFPGAGRSKDDEVTRLKRELAKVNQERDFLKEEAVDSIDHRRHLYPVSMMCRALKVSKSGYYAWRSRPESTRAKTDRQLTRVIRRLHIDSGGVYGSPKILADLQDEGFRVGRNRVARLMREARLRGCSWPL